MEKQLLFEKIKGFFSGVAGNPKTVTRLATIAGGFYMLIQAYKQLRLSKGTERLKQFGSIIAGSTLIYKGLTSKQFA